MLSRMLKVYGVTVTMFNKWFFPLPTFLLYYFKDYVVVYKDFSK